MKTTLRILHLEDNGDDSRLVARALHRSGTNVDIQVARNRKDFLGAIQGPPFDVILSDNNLGSFDGVTALELVREKHPAVPFIFVSSFDDSEVARKKKETTGATDCICKAELDRLAEVIQQIVGPTRPPAVQAMPLADAAYVCGMEKLIEIVQELSRARHLEQITQIVRRAARQLTGADGATFVLRDGDFCYYADEEAIAPLWKGCRFPLRRCISGWAMLHREAVMIDDIYADARVPADAYQPTFVKSLAMMPIRTAAPIGAIGVYWATPRHSQPHEIKLLRALADSTSIAMENVQVYSTLEQRVMERTSRLLALNEELEAFAYSVSHDLQAPLRHISVYLEMVRDEPRNQFAPASLQHLAVVSDAARRMNILTQDLLAFSRSDQTALRAASVDMNRLVADVQRELTPEYRGRTIHWQVHELPEVRGDRGLLKQVWFNLISNAVKFSRLREAAEIEIGGNASSSEAMFFVRDNGVGFDMQCADKLFGTFQRLHRSDEFEGTGIGLAHVRRIVARHQGRTWAEGKLDGGATFYFTLPVAS